MAALVAVVLAMATTLCGLAVAMIKGDLWKAAPYWLPYALFAASVALYILAAILGVLHFRREQATKNLPAVHQENKPENHIENRPVFENNPTIIVSTGEAPASTPESERAYSAVLAFLERTMQRGRAVMYFVENIAAATHLPEQQVFNALQKLVEDGHVFRSPIEGVGTDGGSTRWGHVYWYAHF